MKTHLSIVVNLTLCVFAVLSPAHAARADAPPAATTPAASAPATSTPAASAPATGTPPASAPIKSTRTNGMVVLAPDAALSGGRLVLRVVAYNGKSEPAQLSASAIHITTAAGEAVALIPVEQLIKEVSEAKHAKPSHDAGSSAQSVGSFGHDTGSAMRDSTGNVVHGVNNGANTSGVDLVPFALPADDAADSKQSAAKTQQRVAALKAAILQTLSIAPRSAAGAEIVTEKLNFASSEERVLHVAVDFNGEQHELMVPVPPGS